MTTPVYLFTGFLDSGKSTFIQDTLRDPNFHDGEKTLLIACEDGEVEYEEVVLAAYQTELVYVQEEEQISSMYLDMLDKKYQPDRVLIEFNGMWSVTNFLETEFPIHWLLVQIVTTVDASTFALYMNNMRSILYDQLVHSEMIIMNRIDATVTKSFLRGNVKSINRKAQLIYEDVNGSVNTLLDDALPYDMTSNHLHISQDDYGLWYIDILENSQHYVGKTVTFQARIVEVDHETGNRFLIGREAMVCCAEDIQTIGFIVYDQDASTYKGNTWVEFCGEVQSEYDEGYGGDVPVLYTKTIKRCDKIEEFVSFS